MSLAEREYGDAQKRVATGGLADGKLTHALQKRNLDPTSAEF